MLRIFAFFLLSMSAPLLAQTVPAQRLNEATNALAHFDCADGNKQACYNAAIYDGYVISASFSEDIAEALLERATAQCIGGSAPSCGDAGVIHAAQGTAGTEPSAFRFLTQACDGGDGFSCDRLGDLGYTLYSSTNTQALVSYYDSLKPACEAGDHAACTNRAKLNAYLVEIYADPSVWYDPLIAACNSQFARACAILSYANSRDGQEEHFSKLGIPPNMSKTQSARDRDAFRYATKACDLGNPVGCWNASLSYYNAEGVRKSWKKEQAMLARACHLGYPSACEDLNLDSYWQSTDPLSELKSACDQGDFNTCLIHLERTTPQEKRLEPAYTEQVVSICEMGYREACGFAAQLIRVVTKDYPRALRYARAGCAVQAGSACNVAGALYWQHIDAKDNYIKASEFYTMACELDNKYGCNGIGYFHLKGYHVKQSDTRAAHFFTIACSKNLAVSCFNLSQALKAIDPVKAQIAATKACRLAPKKYCES